LDEFGSQRVAAIRFPVPFGPKSINERRRFLSPIYKLIRYHRLIFDSVADGVFRSTYLSWIDSITHVKAGGKDEIELRLNSNYENVWRVLRERLEEPAARLKSQYSTRHWGRFVRTVVEVEPDEGITGLARWAAEEKAPP
jgi:hypothetical protein